MELTKQQRDPHPQLVAVRTRLEQCGLLRSEAAKVCDGLDDATCDAILKATDDAACRKAIENERKAEEQAAREKRAPKSKAASNR